MSIVTGHALVIGAGSVPAAGGPSPDFSLWIATVILLCGVFFAVAMCSVYRERRTMHHKESPAVPTKSQDLSVVGLGSTSDGPKAAEAAGREGKSVG